MGVYQPVVCEMRGQLRAQECPSVELVSLAWVYISLSQCESRGIIIYYLRPVEDFNSRAFENKRDVTHF